MSKSAITRLSCAIIVMLLVGLGSTSFAKSSAKRRHSPPHDTVVAAATVRASTPEACSGPAICGDSCSLDPLGIPIHCSNGLCVCESGYDLENGACRPIQPEVFGTENVKLIGGYDCPGVCSAAQSTAWATVGSIYNAFDLVPVHGTAPGGEAFMPVWGYQATHCGDHGATIRKCNGGSDNGLNCSTAADCPGGTCALLRTCRGGPKNALPCDVAADCPSGTCDPYLTWAGCAPDPFPFCYGVQGSNPDGFNYDSCEGGEGNGQCEIDPNTNVLYCQEGINQGLPHHPVSPDPRSSVGLCDLCGSSTQGFTSAWPYLGESFLCNFHVTGFDDPARMDFPNNVSVYRAPIRWEDFMSGLTSIIDDDYTWDMESQGHELFDTDNGYNYHHTCNDETHGRIHVEFSSGETVDNFTDDDWGPANQFWRTLRCTADENFCPIGDDHGDNATSCYLKSLVNPGLVCPPAADDIIDNDCAWHDPMAVVVGVPSIDCADDPYEGTDEIHPVLAMAIRIQEDPTRGPEKWAFFYRQHGNAGPCGNSTYSRCLSDFKLPLGLPNVSGHGVLTGADVHVDWHKWADETFGSGSPDITVTQSFDLLNGTVLNIHLPHNEDGVVGLVTVTPQLDTTPPTITCPHDISVQCTGNSGTPASNPALAPFFSGVSATDNCGAASIVNDAPPFFNLGTTPVTFTATDTGGAPASCQANVTVVDTMPPQINVTLSRGVLWPANHKLVDIVAAVTVTDSCDPQATFVLTSITSNEPDNGTGDGDTANDIQNAAYGTADTHFSLRSERSSSGSGRVYTILYTASDGSGNEMPATVRVYVPHDQSGHALSGAGFNVLGSALLPKAMTFALTVMSTPEFDATLMTSLQVGNSLGTIEPVSMRKEDVNCDGIPDVIASYSIAAATSLQGKAAPDDPLAFRYASEKTGGYLVPNIFLLGSPSAATPCPR